MGDLPKVSEQHTATFDYNAGGYGIDHVMTFDIAGYQPISCGGEKAAYITLNDTEDGKQFEEARRALEERVLPTLFQRADWILEECGTGDDVAKRVVYRNPNTDAMVTIGGSSEGTVNRVWMEFGARLEGLSDNNYCTVHQPVWVFDTESEGIISIHGLQQSFDAGWNECMRGAAQLTE